MIRAHKIAGCVLAATLALTAIAGCKKSEPPPESQSGQTQPVAAETRLAKGGMWEAAGKPIDVEIGHLVPRVCDWNNDGKKDLIVGQFASGAIRLYLNQGTDAAPVFREPSLLQAGGKPIRLDAG